MNTTLNQIRDKGPRKLGWAKLLVSLGKTAADDEPLSIVTILDSNGLDDALWCLQAVKGRDREIRLYAVWCARQVQHLMTDPRSVTAVDVAERFANSEATDTERASAWDAASPAAWAAAGDAQEKRLRELCAECEADAKSIHSHYKTTHRNEFWQDLALAVFIGIVAAMCCWLIGG